MIATTLEQSRKLVELGISADTADMHYAFSAIGGAAFQDMIDASAMLLLENYNRKYPYEPAWSLSALLDILPNDLDHTTTLCKGGWDDFTLKYMNEWFCEYEIETTSTITHSENPIDAVFKMIVKLKENKLI